MSVVREQTLSKDTHEETLEEPFVEEADQALFIVETDPPPLPVRFAPPVDADSLADALVAGQLSERTRRAYASDLRELLEVLEAWGLRLSEVNKDHLHAYRS